MNSEDIIRMAREAGLGIDDTRIGFFFYQEGTQGLERFAALVSAAEREECAALAEDTAAGRDAEAIADAIRARRKTHDGH